LCRLDLVLLRLLLLLLSLMWLLLMRASVVLAVVLPLSVQWTDAAI